MPSNMSPMQPGPLTPGQRRLLGSPGPTISPQRPYDLLLRELQQLQGKQRATQQQLESAQIELDEARSRITRDNGIIQRLRTRIVELEELVQKQKQTISNQSKTISDPKSLRSKRSGVGLPATPNRQVSDRTSFDTPFPSRGQHSIYDQPPPRFELPLNVSIPRSGLSSAGALAPVGYEQPRLSPAHDPVPSSISTRSFPHIDFRKTAADFASKYQELWRKAEMFGQMHGNVPNIYNDSHVEQRVKDYLMAISDKSSASFLLSSTATRFFLIAKAINVYLVRDILKITVVKGFDQAADSEIGQIKKQLFPDTPATVRDMMFIAMANQVNDAKRKPGFTEFFQQRIRDHNAKLWQLVGPLTHEASTNAWSDLMAIVSEAHALSLDMYSIPFEYKFEFPAPNDAFIATEMVNRDSFLKGDPTVLMRNDNRVKLGITPTTKMRDNSGASSAVQLIHLANVLLRPPPKQ